MIPAPYCVMDCGVGEVERVEHLNFGSHPVVASSLFANTNLLRTFDE